MKLTNKRLKHLAKRGKASIAEQRELAARVLQAEKPRPQGQRKLMWDLSCEGREGLDRQSIRIRLDASPYWVNTLKPEEGILRIEREIHHRELQTMQVLRLTNDYLDGLLEDLSMKLGKALFASPHIRRKGLGALGPATPNS